MTRCGAGHPKLGERAIKLVTKRLYVSLGVILDLGNLVEGAPIPAVPELHSGRQVVRKVEGPVGFPRANLHPTISVEVGDREPLRGPDAQLADELEVPSAHRVYLKRSAMRTGGVLNQKFVLAVIVYVAVADPERPPFGLRFIE